jgi:hypothetical protein
MHLQINRQVFPFDFAMKASKNADATTKRINADEKGPASTATIPPATKVPPQMSAVSVNLV